MGDLVAYRPTRRAVVRLPAAGGGAPRYVKVLRPGRIGPIVARHRAIEAARRVAGPGFPRFPPILEWSDDEGFIVLGGVPGRSLYRSVRGGGPEAPTAVAAVATAVAALHGVEVAGWELRPVAGRPLDRWTASVAPFLDAPSRATYHSALADLPPAPAGSDPPRLLHGDLHDGNVVLDGADVAVIDLDSVGTGHPATDVGTLGAHIVLRGLQASGDPDAGRRLAARLVRGYLDAGGPAGERAIAAAMARSLFRLACVYVVRPRWRSVCPALLAESARSNPGPSG